MNGEIQFRQGAGLQIGASAMKAGVGTAIGLALALLLAGPRLAFAQAEAQNVAGQVVIEEVLVTARRKEEEIQDVPLAVTALGQVQLEEAGVFDLAELRYVAPSFIGAAVTGRETATAFGIRGQVSSDVLITVDPAVAVYMADVPIGRAYGVGITGTLDIQSAQVLKGPQGTLFGRNTTGGAVLINPNLPGDELEGSLRAGFGDLDRQEFEGVLNLPLGEAVAARLAVLKKDRDGYIENRLPDGEDFYSDDSLTWRASLALTPTDALTSTFILDGLDDKSSGMGTAINNFYTNPFVPEADLSFFFAPRVAEQAAAPFYSTAGGDRNPLTGNPPYSDLEMFGASNITTFDLSEGLTFKSIVGYRSVELSDNSDLDGGKNNDPLPPEFFPPWGVPAIGLEAEQFSDIESASVELQLLGNNDRLDWILGAFYFSEEGDDGARAYQLGFANQVSGGWAQNRSYSIFGQGTYSMTDALNLTLGLRWTKDKRKFFSSLSAINFDGSVTCSLYDDVVPGSQPVFPGGPCPDNLGGSESFSEPTWNLGFDYRLDEDQMLYAAHRRGYRSGAFSSRAVALTQFTAADPETIDDIEVGYKGDLPLGSALLRINTAAYYSSYDDIQRVRVLVSPASGAQYNTIVNAAEATVWGWELEATLLATEGFTLSGFYAYTSAKYDSWEEPNPFVPGATIDQSGFDFPNIPEHSYSITARYQLPLDSSLGELSVQGNVYYFGKTAIWDTDQELPGATESAYTLLNARVNWARIMGGPFDVSLWGKNLGNEKYYRGGLVLPTLFSTGYFGEPRTWGLDLTYSF